MDNTELPNEIATVEDDSNKLVKRGSYPAKELSYTIDFTGKIYTELGHTNYHDKMAIAQAQGLAYASIKQTLSTAQQYGLLELKHNVGYKVTSLFIKIFRPVTEQEKKSAIIESLKSPELYASLFSDFEGHTIPSAAGLENMFIRQYKLNESTAKKAVEVFIGNLKTYNLLSSNNVLFLNPNVTNSESVTTTTTTTTIPAKAIDNSYNKNSSLLSIESPEYIEIPIPLKSTNNQAKLIIPLGYKEEDLDRIAKFVEALK